MLRRCTHYIYASPRSIALSLSLRSSASWRFDPVRPSRREQFDTHELGSTDRHEEP
jgi:hypothetical protein